MQEIRKIKSQGPLHAYLLKSFVTFCIMIDTIDYCRYNYRKRKLAFCAFNIYLSIDFNTFEYSDKCNLINVTRV